MHLGHPNARPLLIVNCRETDPTIIVSRVSKAPTADVDLRRIDPFSEQGVNNLAQLGRAKLTDWLRQGL